MKKAGNHTTFGDFVSRHSTQEECLLALERCRWPTGFICPHCLHAGGYRLSDRRGFECSRCHRQTSVTSGTAFAYVKLPLPKVFQAMYLISVNKQGISSQSLAKLIDCSRQSAWHLLHKFRHAMQDRNSKYRLSDIVETDEAYVGGLAAGVGVRGRSTKHKTPIVAMVERKGDNLTGYIALHPVPNVRSESLFKVIAASIKPGATIRTDALISYKGLTEQGYVHAPETSLGGKRAAVQFQLVHRQISNFKSWLLGTHRNTCRRHLDLYAAEFTWRTNRRNRFIEGASTHQEADNSERLMKAVVTSSPWTWKRIRRFRWTRAKSLAA